MELPPLFGERGIFFFAKFDYCGTNFMASALVLLVMPGVAKMVTLAVSSNMYVPIRFHWPPFTS